MSLYCLPDSYRPRAARPEYFVDDTGGATWQPDVYALAELLADDAGLIDVGCGTAKKLHAIARRHPGWPIIGLDHGDNLTVARKRYSESQIEFCDVDLEHPRASYLRMTGGVVVCADVIEHLVDPTGLLTMLRDSGSRRIVVSTPDRDAVYGPDHRGPPGNPAHVREWNRPEFRALLQGARLFVEWQGLTRSSDLDDRCDTQLVIASA